MTIEISDTPEVDDCQFLDMRDGKQLSHLLIFGFKHEFSKSVIIRPIPVLVS